MSFGDFLERNSVGARLATDLAYNMPAVAIPQPQLVAPSVLARSTKTILNSPGLSLTLTSSGGLMDGQALGGGGIVATGPGGIVVGGGDFGKSKRDDFESRSAGSDNVGGSGDEQEGDNPLKRKRYHRHTPQQIQELESLFKECPHPDEKQRLELSKRLNLEGRQVKFWFQNRRTQMKTQLERHENSILRQENDKLRADNLSLRGAMRSPLCTNCGGPAMPGEVSLEEQHLRIENARLKEELGRVCAIAGKFFSGPISTMPPISTSSLELAAGSNGFGGFIGGVSPAVPALSSSIEFRGGVPQGFAPAPQPVNVMGLERSLFAELALVAMDELVKMANTDRPLWSPSQEAGGKETLNYEEYLREFPRCIGEKPDGFVTEATRESGLVIINSAALVETLMDPVRVYLNGAPHHASTLFSSANNFFGLKSFISQNRWMEMFPCMIARSSTTDVVSTGVGGTRNGALQLMHAELQVLSPFVPVREVRFLRFCKQHAEGLWAVVDVSINSIRESQTAAGNMVCRVLPSGCVVQDMPNGYSKVVWVQHAEYDESGVHQLYRSLLSTGVGFGAQRWIATLQRQCECLAILMSSSTVSGRDQAAIMPAGRRSMLKLAQRMVNNFCAGVFPATLHQWDKLRAGSVDEDIRIMTRKSVNDPGEPPGVVLSAATSVWLPVSTQKLFDFLRDDRFRSEWDVLSNGGPMQEMAHIAKGQDHGNCVSLLRASAAMNANQSSMLILQETWTDSSGSLVVYAPVDIPAMHLVMSGGDSAYVALLPLGFAILPEGPRCQPPPAPVDRVSPAGTARVAGSLLTVAFQILVNSLPTAKLTVESIDTVNNLISCTVQKIKAALHCDN